MSSSSLADQCQALAEGSGCAVVPRSHLEITGRDRSQLLHGLCTNDIKRLQPGEGCEAFLTNVQGKTIGHVYVFCGPESLILESTPGEGANIIRSLDRYVVREDVKFSDRGDQWSLLLLAGGEAAQVAKRVFAAEMPEPQFGHQRFPFAGSDVFARRAPLAGTNSWHLVAANEHLAQLEQALLAAGSVSCSAEAVEVARISARSPVFGRDISVDNLPQEVDRNDFAISFTKGCYLGQETIARIDAMGHVNRLLRRLRFPGSAIPVVGAEISVEGKPVAKITSACYSPQTGGAIALAYVRRGHHEPGTRFPTPWGEATVEK